MQHENPLVAGFDISVNGSPITVDAHAHVVSISVEDDAEWPSMFTVELATTIEQDDPLVWVDNDLFAIGGAVEIKLGYADAPEPVFAGEITGLEPEFSLNRLPALIVRGYDRRHRLTRGRKTRSFVQQKDSDIASQIAGEAGLSVSAWNSWDQLRNARRISVIVDASSDLFKGMHNLRNDRSSTASK